MERNFRNSQGYILESQIREAYGRVAYTLTSHDKMANTLIAKNKRIKIMQIVLSAVTTGGFITAIFIDKQIAAMIGGLLSTLALIYNAYVKNFDLIEEANSHQKTANLLWKIREEYVSLITDFESLTIEEITFKRDDLQNRTFDIYSNSLKTDSKSYKQAQKAIKTEEEQTFSDEEIDNILPNAVRRRNRKIKQND